MFSVVRIFCVYIFVLMMWICDVYDLLMYCNVIKCVDINMYMRVWKKIDVLLWGDYCIYLYNWISY